MNEILLLSCVLFGLGAFGLLVRRNLLFVFLSIEVMINAAAFGLVGVSCQNGAPEGQVLFLLIAAAAAAEIAIGLALLIAYNKQMKTCDLG